MRFDLKLLLLFLLSTGIIFTQKAQASGTYTVGSGQTYTTLKAAFDAINIGGITGAIVLQVAADCSESSSPVLYQSGYGGVCSYTSVNIYPTGATRTISWSVDGTFILLDGADNVTIDGRLGGSGTANSLLLENSSATTAACTIEFQNDATSNYLQYLTIKGATAASIITGGAGVVYFYDTSGTTGNDNNTVQYCTITKSGSNKPSDGIVSWGTTGKENSGLTISNNKFIDIDGRNIFLRTNTTSCTVTNNSIYQTGAFTPTIGVYGIYITSGTSYTITGNYIGGQAASCAGNNYTLNTGDYEFHAIEFSSDVAVGTNTINSNTINNLNITTTCTDATPVSGITTASTATYNVGSSGNANTIGSSSGVASLTDGITIAYNDNTIDRAFAAFNVVGAGTVNITYNTVGGINISGTSTTGVVNLIRIVANAVLTITNNTFGNTAANNISSSMITAFKGISSSSTGNTTISTNTFQNITITSTTTSSTSFIGIDLTASCTSTISANTIKTITSAAPTTSSYYNYGIKTSSGTHTISGNIVRDFTFTGASSVVIVGISAPNSSSYTGTITKNLITGFTAANLTGGGALLGINVSSSTTSVVKIINNVILLTNGVNTSGQYKGININNTCTSVTIYNNTVKLYGSGSASSYWHAVSLVSSTGGTVVLKNNAIQNACTSGTRLCVYKDASVTLTEDYNYLECNNTATIGYYVSNLNFADWNTASGATHNKNSTVTIDANGEVSSPSTSNVQDQGVDLRADATYNVTVDYEGSSRSDASPWIGAYETGVVVSFIWDGSTDSDWKTAANWSGNSVPTSSDDATIPTSGSYTTAPTINEADAVCATLTIQSGGTLNVSSGKLTITALALNSGGALSFSGGEVEMSGSLTWDGGITMTTGTLDVNGNITLSSTMTEAISGGTIECYGNFAGSADDGGYTPTGGTVTMNGGASSTISLHSSANFYDLTVNCSGQTSTLGSAIKVSNNLSISAGTLDASASHYGITCSGGWSNSGTFTPRNGTVTFNGSAAQAVTTGGVGAGKQFYNVTINNTAGTPNDATDVDADAMLVSNNLVVTDGQFQPAASSDFNNVEIQTNGILKPDAGAITVSGAWLNTNGTFTHNSGTVTFDGTSTVTTGGTTAAKAFYNVTLNGTSATLAGNIDIDNIITLTSGTWDVTVTPYNMTVGGNWVNNATFTGRTGTVTFDGTSTLSGGTAPTFYDLTITGTLTGHATNFNVSHNWTNTAGTFTHNSGTVTFTGTSTITTGGATATKKFYNLILNGTSATLGGNIDIDNDFTLTTGTWSTSGGNLSMNIGGDLIRNGGTFTANSSTVTFDGNGTQKINVTADGGSTAYNADITFYNIIVDGTGTNAKVYYNTSGSRKFNITNDLTINTGNQLGFVKN